MAAVTVFIFFLNAAGVRQHACRVNEGEQGDWEKGTCRRRVDQSHARLTIDAAKISDKRILERARSKLTAALRLGRQVLPKQRVVDMPATVELECGLELDLVLGGGRLGVGLLCGVEAVDVGLVVLAVMQFHDLA